MERLKKSQLKRERLASTLEHAYDVELNLLESLVSEKPRTRAACSTSGERTERRTGALATIRKPIREEPAPQAKFMNITLNTFLPRKDINPEETPSQKRRAKSRLSETIRHIEQQYRS